MFNKKFITAFIILAAFLSSGIVAQEVTKTGTTAAKFLNIGIGPRGNGMGGAFTSVANDATALYWNPAGVADVTEYQALFTYTKMFADINLNFFGVVLPFGEFGNLGISVTAVDFGEMEVTTEFSPDGTGEFFTAGSYAFALTYAKYITQEFKLGATFKYIREDIFNSNASGIAFDIGTIFQTPFYGVKFASSITNYGTKMQMEGDDLLVRHDTDPASSGNNETIDAFLGTEEFDLPLRLQIGLSRDFQISDMARVTLAVDATHPNDNSQWVNAGGEIALFNEMIFLRGGYKTLFLEDSQEGLSLGFGMKYSGLSFFKIGIDYSYQKYEYLDNIHSFGVILGF
ncbi:MAG: PorV/PorQ family protein [Melioribacteraceae bacterium]|nr:PorV/PorQ family protein [Melioribacteraceae bacterium]MCF8356594.1 PorV/PorQ family protein [Melioribacteraceae bacterium]MCF8395186.1 PorV/PorQ family protein [Melioribacteraceae bacterium]MCF8420030.1 PorV/PorQ family protein [Melioribacteraceae bacterium]